MDVKKQNKGKTASASISNIAIRFHADDEELEQIVQPSSDSNIPTECSTKQETVEDETNSLSSSSQLSTPTSTQSDFTGISTSSSSSSSVLSRLGKRSASLESATPSETSSGDAWRLFREVRGRITKTVEEKIEEIKSDRLKNTKSKQKPKLGTKVEHSSVSDSEDQSESSCSLKVTCDNLLVSNMEKKDCDNQEKKKSDNQQCDSGRSTPLICSSSSEKDDVPSNNVQKDKSEDEKKKEVQEQSNDKNNGKNKEKERSPVLCEEEKEKPEEKKKEKVDDVSNKKEKKTRRFHFRERFHGSPDKKKHEISIKFSSLKDEEESEDEKNSDTVEYGLEASESVIESDKVLKSPVLKTATPLISRLSKVMDLIWAWRYALLTVLLAILHYIWPANYMLGFFVGTFVTIHVTSAIMWVQESFQLKQSSSAEEFSSENSIYSSITYPIFASSRYFTPCENPEKIIFEGWMNEFSQNYSPDSYHISLTETIHIKLEGSLLTLSNPSTKIPKRAYWNEPEHKKLFNRQRLFDIAGCKIQLLPVGLTHKRIWSKKYPICITLLKMSKMGVRYRCKGKITIDDDQPWLDPDVDAQTPVENNDTLEIFPMDPLEPLTASEDISRDKLAEGDKPQVETTSFCLDDPFKEKLKSSGTGNDSANEDDDEDDEDFVRISPSLLNEFCVYLFARCDRQKEVWFRRLVAAAGFQNASPVEKEKEKDNGDSIMESDGNENKEKQSPQKTPDNLDENMESSSPSKIRYNTEQQYLDYMNRLGQKKVPKLSTKEKEGNSKQNSGLKSSPYSVSPSSTGSSWFSSEDTCSVSEEVMWVNAFAGRLLYDVLRDSFWLNKIQDKFQRKLSAIKLPYFMEELVISHIDFGDSIPLIQRSSKPVLNEDGIWAELDIIYDGHFRVTIDTKLNLMKLKKAQATLDGADTIPLLSPASSSISIPSSNTSSDVFQVSPYTVQKSAIFDSDVEDSAESSSEELDFNKAGPITVPEISPSSPGNTTSNKMLRMVDKIAASKYFQQVTEYKYIKRAMEGVSNTNIALVVEVRGLSGTLVLNFPPPPSNRLWYGFRANPQLILTAQPKVGDRTISLLHISTWIERRLRREFQKLLVLPNMDDLIIPVMNKEQPS